MTSKQNVPLLYLIPGLFLCLCPGGLPGAPDSLKDLSQQIFEHNEPCAGRAAQPAVPCMRKELVCARETSSHKRRTDFPCCTFSLRAARCP